MSVYYPVLGTVYAAIFASFLADFLGLEGLWGTVLLVAAALLAIPLWIYSPLPNNNGGMMSGDPGRYWGWSKSDE